jgi:hypothetical protein
MVLISFHFVDAGSRIRYCRGTIKRTVVRLSSEDGFSRLFCWSAAD